MRNLAQELLDLELWFRRYEGLKFRRLEYDFGKLAGYICEYRICGGLLWKIVGALVKRIYNSEEMERLNC
jgi:hypothetical protein